MAAEAFAPAKINLTLHVTGRRGDGYHLLDSLVAFADIGDSLRAAPASQSSLTVTGPIAADVPTGPDNLVLRAAALMGPPAAFTLDKQLPAAAGLGGGSADAAAALRALARLHGQPLPDRAAVTALGADVPVCLDGRACRMRGIGDILEPVALPAAPLVLVNPGAACPTGAVFRALARRDNPPMPETLPPLHDADALAAFIGAMRNDLEAPAIATLPVIAEVIAELAAAPGCHIARMSGSGASCFGLFNDAASARAATAAIAAAHPGWWVRAGALTCGGDAPRGAAGSR